MHGGVAATEVVAGRRHSQIDDIAALSDDAWSEEMSDGATVKHGAASHAAVAARVVQAIAVGVATGYESDDDVAVGLEEDAGDSVDADVPAGAAEEVNADQVVVEKNDVTGLTRTDG